jgi:hypothetical protein
MLKSALAEDHTELHPFRQPSCTLRQLGRVEQRSRTS